MFVALETHTHYLMDVFLDFQNFGNVTTALFTFSRSVLTLNFRGGATAYKVNAKAQIRARSSWVAQTEEKTRNLNKKFVFNLRLL